MQVVGQVHTNLRRAQAGGGDAGGWVQLSCTVGLGSGNAAPPWAALRRPPSGEGRREGQGSRELDTAHAAGAAEHSGRSRTQRAQQGTAHTAGRSRAQHAARAAHHDAGGRGVDGHVVGGVVQELGARVALHVVRVVVAPPQLRAGAGGGERGGRGSEEEGEGIREGSDGGEGLATSCTAEGPHAPASRGGGAEPAQTRGAPTAAGRAGPTAGGAKPAPLASRASRVSPAHLVWTAQNWSEQVVQQSLQLEQVQREWVVLASSTDSVQLTQ